MTLNQLRRPRPGPNQKPECSGPVEAIKYHMAQQGLTQRDLIPMIGSRSKVSEVLSGTRSLTMPMARALHRHLGVPADVLLKEQVLRPQKLRWIGGDSRSHKWHVDSGSQQWIDLKNTRRN